MYFHRTIESTLKEYSKQFQALVIYGARQVGKSSTVYEMFVRSSLQFNYVSLDDIDDRSLAQNNPKLFLQNYNYPLVIDEIQKAPKLLDEIKIKIDKQRTKWMNTNEPRKLLYVLTGSNKFELAAGISESLAGRCGILEMYSFTNSECQQKPFEKFVPNISYFKNRADIGLKKFTYPEIYQHIFDGGMPDVATRTSKRESYFKSYVNTYLERDVLQIINTTNEIVFRNFLQVLALRTGQILKISEISNIVGIDVKTTKRWLSILKSSGIVYLLQPYLTNKTKRVIKSPKLYFMDTGLCCYLCNLQDSVMLSKGIMSGAMFETYIVSEIIKNLSAYGVEPSSLLFYYRDFDKKEIDILYIANNSITPIEIKSGISPNKASKNFDVLGKYKMPINKGFVIENCDRIRPLNENVYIIPAYLI